MDGNGIGGGRGGRGGHMTPKTNFSPGPAIGARARRPCVRHLQCGRRDGEAVTERRGEERRGTNYSSHELRLRGQKRERSASATVEQEGGYPLFGEGERKTWEDAR